MSERSPSGTHRYGSDRSDLDADRGPGTACGVSIRLEEQAVLEAYARESGSPAAPAAARAMVRTGDCAMEAAQDAAVTAGTLRPAPVRGL